jgi:uncharacterized protein (DUF2062 family)
MLLRIRATSHSIALGFAAGVFISFTPLLGLNLLLAALITVVLRGNIVASAIGTLVGNPVTFPIIWLGSFQLGTVVLPHSNGITPDPASMTGHLVEIGATIFWPIMIGGMLIGAVAAVISYFIVCAAVDEFHRCKLFPS